MKEHKVKWNVTNSVRTELMGIATLLVVLNHSKCFEWNSHLEIMKKLFSEGGIGVDIFLLLSGMGLYYSFSKCTDRKEFYRRRFLRIIPVYLPLAIIFAAIIGYFGGGGRLNLLDYVLRVMTISYWIKGDGIYWYVSYILVFYLLYPLIYKYLLQKDVKPMIPIACMFVVEVVFLVFFNEYYVMLQLALSRLPITILACYLGKYAYEEKEVSIIRIVTLLIPFLLLRGIRIIFVPEMYEALVTFLVKTANMFLIIFFVYFYWGIDKFIFPIIKRVFSFVGRYSLEIYLIHMSLISIVHDILGYDNVLIYFILIVPGTVIISYLYQWGVKKCLGQ